MGIITIKTFTEYFLVHAKVKLKFKFNDLINENFPKIAFKYQTKILKKHIEIRI